MFRRLFVQTVRRAFLLLLVVCLGCAAQSAPSELSKRIERHVRAYYNLPPGVAVTISPMKPSEFPNYDAVVITIANGTEKQNYDFLVGKDGKSLVRMTKLDLSSDPYAELMKKINVEGRPTRGNKAAKVVAVNYDDFQCPFCSKMHSTLFPELLKEYGDRVLFIYKDYPLAEMHLWATHAAVNANCLAAQNNDAYWDYADYLHANQREINGEKGREAQFARLDQLALAQGQTRRLDLVKLQSCLKAQKDDAVKVSMHEGDMIGVSSTPTLFINGRKVDGAVPEDEMRSIFDQALKDAGVASPAATSTGSSK